MEDAFAADHVVLYISSYLKVSQISDIGRVSSTLHRCIHCLFHNVDYWFMMYQRLAKVGDLTTFAQNNDITLPTFPDRDQGLRYWRLLFKQRAIDPSTMLNSKEEFEVLIGMIRYNTESVENRWDLLGSKWSTIFSNMGINIVSKIITPWIDNEHFMDSSLTRAIDVGNIPLVTYLMKVIKEKGLRVILCKFLGPRCANPSPCIECIRIILNNTPPCNVTINPHLVHKLLVINDVDMLQLYFEKCNFHGIHDITTEVSLTVKSVAVMESLIKYNIIPEQILLQIERFSGREDVEFVKGVVQLCTTICRPYTKEELSMALLNCRTRETFDYLVSLGAQPSLVNVNSYVRSAARGSSSGYLEELIEENKKYMNTNNIVELIAAAATSGEGLECLEYLFSISPPLGVTIITFDMLCWRVEMDDKIEGLIVKLLKDSRMEREVGTCVIQFPGLVGVVSEVGIHDLSTRGNRLLLQAITSGETDTTMVLLRDKRVIQQLSTIPFGIPVEEKEDIDALYMEKESNNFLPTFTPRVAPGIPTVRRMIRGEIV